MIKLILEFLFGKHEVCDDTPDSRGRPYQHKPTGMEFDSGEDMLKND
jgi:hypothetical protein